MEGPKSFWGHQASEPDWGSAAIFKEWQLLLKWHWWPQDGPVAVITVVGLSEMGVVQPGLLVFRATVCFNCHQLNPAANRLRPNSTYLCPQVPVMGPVDRHALGVQTRGGIWQLCDVTLGSLYALPHSVYRWQVNFTALPFFLASFMNCLLTFTHARYFPLVFTYFIYTELLQFCCTRVTVS